MCFFTALPLLTGTSSQRLRCLDFQALSSGFPDLNLQFASMESNVKNLRLLSESSKMKKCLPTVPIPNITVSSLILFSPVGGPPVPASVFVTAAAPATMKF